MKIYLIARYFHKQPPMTRQKTKIAFACPRCDYESMYKNDMRRHLYKNKNICLPIKQDIELTDEIKKIILRDRIYRAPKAKKPIKEPKQVCNDSDVFMIQKEIVYNYIYLIRPKENVKHCENIYKVGQTKTLDSNIPRISSYGKGSELIAIIRCVDSLKLEQDILQKFNKTFKKYIFGNEYFVGDYQKMLKIIHDTIYNEYLDNKKIVTQVKVRSSSF